MTRPALQRDHKLAKVYSHQQVCELVGLSYNALRELRERRQLPFAAMKLGSQWRYPRAEVDAWLSGDFAETEALGE